MEKLTNLRKVTNDDEQFLNRLYASTREEELAVLPWNVEEKKSFLDMQFKAQSSFYKEQFCDDKFYIIEQNGNPIGRLYLEYRKDEIRIVDISLLPENRGEGIGSKYLKEVLNDGRKLGLPVKIHVEHNNPALQLYKRLGFNKISEQGVYFMMEKLPENNNGE